VTGDPESADGVDVPRWVGAIVPIVLLAVLVGAVLAFPPFGGIESGEPLPDVAVSHMTLPDEETLVLHVTNAGARVVPSVPGIENDQ